jgi:uncharacterized membrane protein HdeD (DUF308 family)
MIIIASVLLLGIVILAVGHFTGNRIALYAGVLVTLTGVFTGIQRLSSLRTDRLGERSAEDS